MSEDRALLVAMRSANWDELLPKLAAYAERRLRRVGWAEGRDQAPSKMAVMEAVDEAVARCLSGKRSWHTDVDLETLLCGVIRSIISSAKKADTREPVDPVGDDVDLIHNPDANEVAEAERSDILTAAAACAQGDPDLEELYLIVTSEEGPTKREDIATALGWPVARVSAARVKLQRRLDKEFPDLFASAKKRRSR